MTAVSGEVNLEKLLASIKPYWRPGRYVFSRVDEISSLPLDKIFFFFREGEAITVVLKQADADDLGLPYEFVSAWITLSVHSSLEAVGLTAVFSGALAAEGLSCNVVAGYYHDHAFVKYTDAAKAIDVLEALSRQYGRISAYDDLDYL